MGYSYAAKAGFTLDALGELIGAEMSNGMPDGGFYETGRENVGGAITGTVWKSAGGNLVTKRGYFNIQPDGFVKAFPGLPAAMLRKAEKMSNEKYAERYGAN